MGRYLSRKVSLGLHAFEKLLRVCTNLRVGSCRNEQLPDDNPVPAVHAVASEEVLVLFFRPPARVSSPLASRGKGEGAKPTKRKTRDALLMCSPLYTKYMRYSYVCHYELNALLLC